MNQKLRLDIRVYDLDTIKKAAYKFIDQFSIEISLAENDVICTFSFTHAKSEESIQYYISEFNKELLDQDLRQKIKLETEGIRNLILAHAFSKTSLVNE